MLAAQTTAMKTRAFAGAMLSAQLRAVLGGPSLPSRGRALATAAGLRGGGDAPAPAGKVPLSEATLNPSLVKASYAVRGAVLDRAMALTKQLHDQPGSLPFDEVVACNIGNPQALGQPPLSFHRQVLALTLAPELMDHANSAAGQKGATFPFPADVLARAAAYRAATPSLGAYSHSQGIPKVRQEVAAFIEQRDGAPAGSVNPDSVFLTNGASDGVRMLMTALLRKAPVFNDGVLVPIPQYPLYSATCALVDGALVPYYLDEANEWGLNVASELKVQLDTARHSGCSVRGLVVINPGNPTGQTLTHANMQEVVQLCADEGLVLLADEVYQENIWRPDRPFVSFRKVAASMGYTDSPDSGLALVSFHSISKGFIGECGLRGGYFELFGLPTEVKAQLYKLASISLCANTPGQVMTGLMVAPPQLDDPSGLLYAQERQATLDSLARRAAKVAAGLDALPGVSCRPSDGALYAFPKIDLPAKFVAEAAARVPKPIPADELYCLQLVDATGVVVVPGSGFGQAPGTWHFRTTFLPPEHQLDGVLSRVETFHRRLMAQYA